MLRRSTSFPVMVFLVAAPSLAACGTGDDPDAVTTFTDSAGITIAVSDPAVAPACSLSANPRTTIGVASGDPDQELYRVFGAARLSTGEIAVENQGSQQIRVYDAGGRFVRAFGREGEGPGEFRDMFGLWRLAGDTLWVGDYRPWRYQVYTADGEWVRTVQPEPAWVNPPRQWGMLSGGRAVLGDPTRPAPDRTFPETELIVTLYDWDGAPVDTLGRFGYRRLGSLADGERPLSFFSPFFDASTSIAAGGDRLAIGHGSESEVRIHEMPEGTTSLPAPSLILRWRTGDRTVTADDVAAEKDRIREQYADLDPAMFERMVAPMLDDRRPAAEVFPAHVGFTFGEDGSIWVTEYPEAGGDGGRTHLVFEQHGALRCRVGTPPGLSLYEVGADYVLGEHRDAAPVERVLLYGFTDR